MSVDLASEVSVELESEVSVELERNARPKRRVGVRGDPFRCLGRCIDVRNHKLGCGLWNLNNTIECSKITLGYINI